MKSHVSLKILGGVQGVGFRMAAKEQAASLGICGYAMNRDDGSVCIQAEGEAEDVRVFIEWCKSGPPGAQVGHIDITDGEPQGYPSFDIRRKVE